MNVKQVLFVDDEMRVLDALQRMLRPFRAELEMDFATSGEQALSMMKTKKYDIIVSDIRMPGMGGAELLDKVKTQYPDTIRFALSGQSDQETWMRALGSAHQFLSKPCNAEKIRNCIIQAASLRDKLSNGNLRDIVAGAGTLPSPPQTYNQIMSLMQQPDCSVAEIGSVVEKDVAMSAKVLQLANSAAVGIHSRIASPSQAVTLLGLGTLRAMILLIHIFDNFHIREPSLLQFLERFHNHSLAVAQAARRIAQYENADKNLIQEAAIAGMLHDVGSLIFASQMPARYAEVLKRLGDDSENALVAAEIEEFGASHEETGAYLLAIWGLSDPIVEAVAFHHTPAASVISTFAPLVPVHVADCLSPPGSGNETPAKPSEPDAIFISRLNLSEKLQAWRAIVAAPQHQ